MDFRKKSKQKLIQKRRFDSLFETFRLFKHINLLFYVVCRDGPVCFLTLGFNSREGGYKPSDM